MDVYQLHCDLHHNANGISHKAAVHQCSDVCASERLYSLQCGVLSKNKCCWDLQEGSVIQFPVYLGLLVTLTLINKGTHDLKFSSFHLGGRCKRSITDMLTFTQTHCLLSCAPQKRSLEDE